MSPSPAAAAQAVPPRRVRSARYAITLAFFLHAVVYTTWVPRIPQVRESLGLDNAELAQAFIGVAVGPLLAIPVVGRACWRYGSRPLVRLALTVYSASLALPAVAPGLPVLFLAMVLLSAANAGLAVAMNTHGVTVETHYHRPMFASVHAANSFGGLVGAGTGTLAAGAAISPTVHLGLAAATCTAWGVLGTRRLLPAASDRRLARAPGKRVRLQPHLLGLGVLALCVFLAESAVTNWGSVYATDSLNASPAVAGVAFTAFAGAMGLGRLATDPLVARFGAVATVRVGATLAAAGAVVAVVPQHVPTAVVGFALMGAGLAASVPAALRAAGDNPHISRASGIAAVSIVGYLGFLSGPVLFGALAALVGLASAFGSIALLALAAALFASAVAPARPPRTIARLHRHPTRPELP